MQSDFEKKMEKLEKIFNIKTQNQNLYEKALTTAHLPKKTI